MAKPPADWSRVRGVVPSLDHDPEQEAIDRAERGSELLTQADELGMDDAIQDASYADLEAMRTYLNNDLFAFAQFVFGFHDLVPSLHGDLAAWISDWGWCVLADGSRRYFTDVSSTDVVVQDNRRIMTQIPREFFKSSIGTRANALWQIVREPHMPVAIFNEKADNADKWLKGIRDVAQSSKLFQQVYKDLLPPGIHYRDRERGKTTPRNWKWSDSEVDFQGKRVGEVEASISAHGIESAAVGGHWPKLIFDDLISFKHRLSVSEMERAREWFKGHIYLMRPAERSCAYINCTPWTYTDIYVDAAVKFNYRLYRRSALELPNGEPDIALGTSIFPQKLSTKQLQAMHARDPFGFNCTPAETPITMADWSVKQIEFVRPGDHVVGMKNIEGSAKRSLELATVLDCGSIEREVFEYRLSNGESVRCTEDHEWLRQKRGYGPIHLTGPAPSTLGYVHSVADCHSPIDAAWLSGFFDGEGSVSAKHQNGHGGFICFAQSNKYPEINDRVAQVLDTLGFQWKVSRYDQANHGMNLYRLLGGRPEKARFIQWCRPAKVKQITASMLGGRGIAAWVSVASKLSLGIQRVYWLHTTTGNYIAWGYLSKNSQMMCIPKPGASQSFDSKLLRAIRIETDEYGERTVVIDDAAYDPSIGRTENEPPPPQRVPLHQLDKCVILDPAPSEPTAQRQDPNARNGLIAVGMDCWGRRYLLESWADRLDYTHILDQIFALSAKWACDRLHVEEVNFSNVYRHWIAREQLPTGKFAGRTLRVLPLAPKGREKHARILARQPEVTAGLWYVNVEGTGQFQVEFSEYPNSSTVDLLDCFAYSAECLQRPFSPSEHALLKRTQRLAPYSEPYYERGLESY